MLWIWAVCGPRLILKSALTRGAAVLLHWLHFSDPEAAARLEQRAALLFMLLSRDCVLNANLFAIHPLQNFFSVHILRHL